MVMNAYAIPGIKRELRLHVRNLEAYEIIKIVCDHFDFQYELLAKKHRYTEYVYARDWCMYLLTQHTSLGLITIGKYFNRDHTTAMHARDKIKRNISDSRYSLHEKYLRDDMKLSKILEQRQTYNKPNKTNIICQ